jgi:ribosome-binding ATPase YchF (GTP1/OBG family)
MLVGVVGKPNTGKSTFFSSLTLIPIPIENRPFTTIKPNRGIAYLRSPCVCREFNVTDHPQNSICINGIRLIPIELVDCAGLIPGSWQGKGLGNYFLDEIMKADALIHIVDVAGATDEEGNSCEPGTRNPIIDVEFLEYEITMWLMGIIKKDWKRICQKVDTTRITLEDLLLNRLSGLSIKKAHITTTLKQTELDVDTPAKWTEEDLILFTKTLRKISKPMIIAANKIDLPYAEANIKLFREKGYNVVPCCAEAELALRRAAEKGLIDYIPGECNFNILEPKVLTVTQKSALITIKSRILERWGSTGVQEVLNRTFFNLLQMIAIYPVENVERLSNHNGHVLPDVYLISYGTTAKEFAYMIHTELGEGFIHAINVRTKRRLGEDYILRGGDVIKIFSAKRRT